MLPSGPLMGDKSSATVQKPFSSANPTTFWMTSRWISGSLTTPFLPTFPLPASNWGLTRQTKHAPSLRRRQATGRTRVREINETSMEMKSMGSGTCSSVT